MLFKGLTTLFTVLAASVQATPLSRRDVIAPHITNPHAGTVWPIGTVQTVTWDTSNFPPDSQITNPIGKVILGFNSSTSLNLDFNNPLAQNFKLRDGKVNITVPNVPPKDDYLIVLFGDSGNTSPAFAIARISGSSGTSSTTTQRTVTSASSSASASTSSDSVSPGIPITGSVITGGVSSTITDAGTTTDSITATETVTNSDSVSPTPTSPSVSASATDAGSSTTSSSTTSASGATQSQPSAAKSLVHNTNLCGGMIVAGLIMLAMV